MKWLLLIALLLITAGLQCEKVAVWVEFAPEPHPCPVGRVCI
jgi:hypothetical protein